MQLIKIQAGVMELVDMLRLERSAARRVGSSPLSGKSGCR